MKFPNPIIRCSTIHGYTENLKTVNAKLKDQLAGN